MVAAPKPSTPPILDDTPAARARSDAFLRQLRAQGLTDEDLVDETTTPITAAQIAELAKADGNGAWPK